MDVTLQFVVAVVEDDDDDDDEEDDEEDDDSEPLLGKWFEETLFPPDEEAKNINGKKSLRKLAESIFLRILFVRNVSLYQLFRVISDFVSPALIQSTLFYSG